MPPASPVTRYNLEAIEDAYQRWQKDASTVDASWRTFFEGFELGSIRCGIGVESAEQTSVVRLIDAYRDLGHFQAHIDPLSDPPPPHPQLAVTEFGLSESDLDRTFDTSHFLGLHRGTLRQLVAALRETYCRTIGVEYRHIQDTRMRGWLEERMEPRRNQPQTPRRQKMRILMELHFAELFERFLHTRYVGQKRFSLEGAETLVPVMDAIVEKAGDGGVQEMVIGMAHRGRLNLLANIIGKPYEEIFAEFEDNFLPDSFSGDGDVKYHQGFSADRVTARGGRIHLSLTPNPSHLEVVDPVVEGRTRAKQELFGDRERMRGLPLLIHGDAAFAGQGLVAETLNLSQLHGYTTGGTVHIIVNNQIGFTTSPTDARSTHYCTDVAKLIQAPIFHVNAEDPEAAVYVTELAFEFRQTFHRDVVIDLVCYRRHGHNEGDEPSFTQPLMYSKIRERPTLTEVYTEQLVLNGVLSADECKAIDDDFHAKLHESQAVVKSGPRKRKLPGFEKRWTNLDTGYTHAPVPTGIPAEQFQRIADVLCKTPDGLAVHPKIARLLEVRKEELTQHQRVDWALAEALAFGSLLLEGTPVRLSGQDSRRGTFSHRHAFLTDVRTGERFVPLRHLGGTQAMFHCFDSSLAEAAVLGFEFGYSLDDPYCLVLWEAQFGDFANGAQPVIDQFIVCSEPKWQRASGLVMLLPHGYEGQGPEHSSARLERFLQMVAENNIQVANLSTPAQYFHILRRQMKRAFRKPLVLMAPKSLLRHKSMVSPVADFTSGHFHEVLDDVVVDPARARRVLFCSGKVYYDLIEKRPDDVAIVRLEQIAPFPTEAVQKVLARYRRVKEWAWVQEESQNMGAWFFVDPLLRALGCPVEYVGRDASASPATGSLRVHQREQKEIVEAALGQPLPHVVRALPDAKPTPAPTGERPALASR